jgi:hypothetical protein
MTVLSAAAKKANGGPTGRSGVRDAPWIVPGLIQGTFTAKHDGYIAAQSRFTGLIITQCGNWATGMSLCNNEGRRESE